MTASLMTLKVVSGAEPPFSTASWHIAMMRFLMPLAMFATKASVTSVNQDCGQDVLQFGSRFDGLFAMLAHKAVIV